MTTIPLSEAKDKLSALVERAERTHEIVTITRHGRPVVAVGVVEVRHVIREQLERLDPCKVDADRDPSPGSGPVGSDEAHPPPGPGDLG